jgi:hypothetical protein
MPDPVIARYNRPQSLNQLAKGRGWGSELTGFLIPMARQDFIYHEYDFCETAITDDPNTDWGTDDGGGTSSAVYATVANAENGTIKADTGTDDNKGIALIHDSICLNPDKNPGMHVIMQIDDVSEAAVEIGMCDALTDESLVAVTDRGDADYTIGNGLAAGVILGYDTDTTTQQGFDLVTEGATDGAEGVAVGSTTAANPIGDATDFDAIVQAYANKGYAIMNHNLTLAQGLAVGADADQLMRYRIFVGTRNTTAKFPTIDLIRIWRNRV